MTNRQGPIYEYNRTTRAGFLLPTRSQHKSVAFTSVTSRKLDVTAGRRPVNDVSSQQRFAFGANVETKTKVLDLLYVLYLIDVMDI